VAGRSSPAPPPPLPRGQAAAILDDHGYDDIVDEGDDGGVIIRRDSSCGEAAIVPPHVLAVRGGEEGGLVGVRGARAHAQGPGPPRRAQRGAPHDQVRWRDRMIINNHREASRMILRRSRLRFFFKISQEHGYSLITRQDYQTRVNIKHIY
jgi:hypothetical protein